MSEITLVPKFAAVMAERIQANSHKSGWDGMSLRQLLHRLEQEIGELRYAIDNEQAYPHRIIAEAADVANFAAMIADNASEPKREDA
jgi:NTP pyrophosphatase (non-canonical NTP hydrolase)